MLYLHSGWPRTGTTSFQFALGKSRAELLAAGIAYPTEAERSRSRGHQELAVMLESNGGDGGGIEELAESLGRYDCPVLLSTEGVTNFVKPGLPRLSRFIGAIEDDVTCLWTLRRIDQFYASMHLHQGLKEGMIDSASDFFHRRHQSGWFERFVRGIAELEQASVGSVFTKYDPGGGHHDELLESVGVPGPVRSAICERVHAGRRRGATVTHKTAIVLNNRELFSERAGVEITLNKMHRLVRSGKPIFEDDSELAVVDGDLRILVHRQALDVSRRLDFEPYPSFFEADEIEAIEPRALEIEAITDDDLQDLVAMLQPGPQ